MWECPDFYKVRRFGLLCFCRWDLVVMAVLVWLLTHLGVPRWWWSCEEMGARRHVSELDKWGEIDAFLRKKETILTCNRVTDRQFVSLSVYFYPIQPLCHHSRPSHPNTDPKNRHLRAQGVCWWGLVGDRKASGLAKASPLTSPSCPRSTPSRVLL